VLQNLSHLENSVAESAHFVLFFSAGFFKSVNCRREVMKAMDLDKPITIMFEPTHISVDQIVEMKDEFNASWPEDPNSEAVFEYIFKHNPIMWISNGKQFSLESIKLVTGRLLKGLPWYQKNSGLLDAGMKINGDIEPVEILIPLDILYCHTNGRAHDLANKLAEECKGDTRAREINLSHIDLRQDDKQAVMLVYLNKITFQEPGCLLCDSIVRAIDQNIKVVLVHENGVSEGGCAFGEVMNQTPKKLFAERYAMYAQDIAVSLYSTKEYEEVSIYQILTKMGAQPINSRRMKRFVEGAGAQLQRRLKPIKGAIVGLKNSSKLCRGTQHQ